LRADRDGVLVGTGAGAVRLGAVQPAGKKAMAAADWLRGLRTDGDLTLGG
jgi:methionyl-tRNA formyltransferase